MLFTNDLDQSRDQSFRDVHGELLGYIEDAGIRWSDERRFAPPPSVLAGRKGSATD